MQTCGWKRPNISDEIVHQVLEEHYGLELLSACKLPGYDDYSAVVTYQSNSSATSGQQKAVIKVLGYDNSCKNELQQFLGPFLTYLGDCGVTLPTPLHTRHGDYLPPKTILNHTDLPCQGHYIHLLTFIEGTVLDSVEYSAPYGLLEEIGIAIARMHKSMKLYDDAILPAEDPPRAWNLCNPGAVVSRVDKIGLACDDAVICRRALNEWKLYFERHSKSLNHSILHGDLNINNIIVTDNSSKLQLSGFIDILDVIYGPAMIDLATLIISVQAKSVYHSDGRCILDTTRAVLQGYTSEGTAAITGCEMELLYYCIAARCAQIVVLCQYDALSDPDNIEYLLADNEDTLIVLRHFYETYKLQDFLDLVVQYKE